MFPNNKLIRERIGRCSPTSPTISSGNRTKLFTALSGAAGLGTLCFLLLRNKRVSDGDDLVNMPVTESSLNVE
jgi:hypothetical protein